MSLNLNEIDLLNPPDDVYFMQLNIIRDIFNNDYEAALMASAIKNTELLFFQTLGELGSSSQVDCVSGNLELAKVGTISLDSLESITNWSETGNAPENGQGSFSVDTNVANRVEGTGSLKLDLSSPNFNKNYKIEKTITSTDWSSYNEVKVWIKSDHPNESCPTVALVINGAETSYLEVSQGSGYYTFDISGLSRSAVTSWGLWFHQNDTTPHIIYIDDYVGVTITSDYHTSGWAESSTVNTISDIDQIYIYDKIANEPIDTTIVLKISLDGGTTWHTVSGSERNKWIDVSTWIESFTNLTNLKIRAELTTTNVAVTPQYDDIMVAYKLKV